MLSVPSDISLINMKTRSTDLFYERVSSIASIANLFLMALNNLLDNVKQLIINSAGPGGEKGGAIS